MNGKSEDFDGVTYIRHRIVESVAAAAPRIRFRELESTRASPWLICRASLSLSREGGRDVLPVVETNLH